MPVGTLDGRIRLKGFGVDLVGTVPITERFSAFARGGVNHAEARDHFASSGRVVLRNANVTERDTNIKFGAGLQFKITPAWVMRLEAERYRINDGVGNKGDVDMVSLGLVYRFGTRVRTPEPAAIVAVAPAPPPPAAAPAPPATPAPAPVLPPPVRRVTFSADALFDFDKATLKPAGKEALDRFAKDLAGTTYSVIRVSGHTDRIGSPAYNTALSTRRADAVTGYLGSAGVAPGKMSATGMGESSPVTKAGECRGEKATRVLIDCLARDRRVEVEVTGTQQ